MSRTTVTFNGHDLTAECYVSDLRRPLLVRNLGSVEVPGMDGELATGQTLAPFDLGLTLTITGRDPAYREQVRQRIADILNTAGEAPLAISEDNGLYYMARFHSTTDGIRSVNADSFEATFRISDPVRYGQQREIFVPIGSPVTFTVGGTAPTMPTLVTLISASGENQYWRAALEDGSYVMLQPLTYGTSLDYDSINVNCESRVMTSRNVVKMLPPSADWLVLTPGEHTITVTSDTGVETDTFVSWRERWL